MRYREWGISHAVFQTEIHTFTNTSYPTTNSPTIYLLSKMLKVTTWTWIISLCRLIRNRKYYGQTRKGKRRFLSHCLSLGFRLHISKENNQFFMIKWEARLQISRKTLACLKQNKMKWKQSIFKQGSHTAYKKCCNCAKRSFQITISYVWPFCTFYLEDTQAWKGHFYGYFPISPIGSKKYFIKLLFVKLV